MPTVGLACTEGEGRGVDEGCVVAFARDCSTVLVAKGVKPPAVGVATWGVEHASKTKDIINETQKRENLIILVPITSFGTRTWPSLSRSLEAPNEQGIEHR
ncbi:MAG: hypothetical protein J7M05_01965 [Anaerolineae bacterium]|nr:hypothetical protein [Anaerolineae bacterium]